MVPWSPRSRWRAIHLHAAGLSTVEIGQQMKRSRSSVHYIIKRYHETGTIQHRPRSGRPLKIPKVNEARICRAVQRYHPFKTADAIVQAMNLPISANTLVRILKKHGIEAYAPLKAPCMNTEEQRGQ